MRKLATTTAISRCWFLLGSAGTAAAVILPAATVVAGDQTGQCFLPLRTRAKEPTP